MPSKLDDVILWQDETFAWRTNLLVCGLFQMDITLVCLVYQQPSHRLIVTCGLCTDWTGIPAEWSYWLGTGNLTKSSVGSLLDPRQQRYPCAGGGKPSIG